MRPFCKAYRPQNCPLFRNCCLLSLGVMSIQHVWEILWECKDGSHRLFFCLSINVMFFLDDLENPSSRGQAWICHGHTYQDLTGLRAQGWKQPPDVAAIVFFFIQYFYAAPWLEKTNKTSKKQSTQQTQKQTPRRSQFKDKTTKW